MRNAGRETSNRSEPISLTNFILQTPYLRQIGEGVNETNNLTIVNSEWGYCKAEDFLSIWSSRPQLILHWIGILLRHGINEDR